MPQHSYKLRSRKKNLNEPSEASEEEPGRLLRSGVRLGDPRHSTLATRRRRRKVPKTARAKRKRSPSATTRSSLPFKCARIPMKSEVASSRRSPQESVLVAEMLHLIQLASSHKQPEEALEHVKKITRRVFSSVSVLGVSFVAESEAKDHLRLDLAGVRQLFAQYQQLDASVKDADVMKELVGAIGSLLSQLKERSSPSKRSTLANKTLLLRALVFLLEFPLLSEGKHYDAITGPLFCQLRMLPRTSHDLLAQLFATYAQEDLERLVRSVQHFITMKLNWQGSMDDEVKHAIHVLSIFHKANESARLLPYRDFYNDAVNEGEFVDIKSEYDRWVQWREKASKAWGGSCRSEFSVCDYSFILDPFSKTKFIRAQSQRDQMRHVTDALVQAQQDESEPQPYFLLTVHRDNIVADTVRQIRPHMVNQLKKPLRVTFHNEVAVDAGGVKKEFFQLIIREIFNPNYGMFVQSDETHQFWFNSSDTNTEERPDLLKEFELVGLLLGLAVYNAVLLDVHFPPFLYKKLLNPRCQATLEDMDLLFPDLTVGLRRLLLLSPGDVEALDSTFEITVDHSGSVATVPLVPNGENVKVTAANRQEFVQQYVKFKLESSVKDQFNAFFRGFRTLCTDPALPFFNHEELEQLVCGSPCLDFVELERITRYVGFPGGLSMLPCSVRPAHPIIEAFWKWSHDLSPKQQRTLLFFATGCSRAPIRGLGKLDFVLQCGGSNEDELPSAHTCFNTLILPLYSSKEKMVKKFAIALENAEGFGLR